LPETEQQDREVPEEPEEPAEEANIFEVDMLIVELQERNGQLTQFQDFSSEIQAHLNIT